MKLIKFYNPRFSSFNEKEQTDIVIDSVATLISKNANRYQKKAATLLLKAFIPNWKEMIPKEYRVFKRSDPEVRAWKKRVLERDNNKCVDCESDKDLHVHHIVEWSIMPELRVEDNNGVTLCKTCHASEHVGTYEKLILSTRSRKEVKT